MSAAPRQANESVWWQYYTYFLESARTYGKRLNEIGLGDWTGDRVGSDYW